MGLSAERAAQYLRGAWRLFRFDRQGFGAFENTPEAFWQSFWCAALVSPLWTIGLWLRALGSGGDPGAAPDAGPSFLRVATVEVIAYVMVWVAFPLAMVHIVRFLDRQDRYFGYFAAYNWVNAPQVLLTVAVSALLATGLFPGDFGLIVNIAALFYSFGVLWFLARAGLDLPGGTATLVVVIDVLLNQLVFTVGGELLR